MDLLTDLQGKVETALEKKAQLEAARADELASIAAAKDVYASAEARAKAVTASAEAAYNTAAKAVEALQRDVQGLFSSVLGESRSR